MLHRHRLLLIGLVAAAPLGVLVAHDHEATGIFKTRHEGYEKLGEAFKTIRDGVRESSPDMTAIRAAAKVAKDTSEKQFEWFPAGSGPEANPKTRAKAEIWSKPADFAAAQKQFATQAAKFDTVAAGNDVAALRAQFGELGKACKNCHDSFRTPED